MTILEALRLPGEDIRVTNPRLRRWLCWDKDCTEWIVYEHGSFCLYVGKNEREAVNMLFAEEKS